MNDSINYGHHVSDEERAILARLRADRARAQRDEALFQKHLTAAWRKHVAK